MNHDTTTALSEVVRELRLESDGNPVPVQKKDEETVPVQKPRTPTESKWMNLIHVTL